MCVGEITFPIRRPENFLIAYNDNAKTYDMCLGKQSNSPDPKNFESAIMRLRHVNHIILHEKIYTVTFLEYLKHINLNQALDVCIVLRAN